MGVIATSTNACSAASLQRDRLRGAFEHDALAEEILLCVGAGSVLVVGSGRGELVRALLAAGVDAVGVDFSPTDVEFGNSGAPGRFIEGSVLKLPVDGASFDSVVAVHCLEPLSHSDVNLAFQELRRVCKRNILLFIATSAETKESPRDRPWWEARGFEAGLRKHPGYYRLSAYEALQNEGEYIRVLLEPVSDEALRAYPLSVLAQERDLHMDMLREPGPRSDAHVARYEWACQFVRPGDRVLDAACGLGYGSYVVQTMSAASHTLGVDGSDFAVDYGTHCFSHVTTGLEFRVGLLPECLLDLPDQSVDIVISFETLEHVEEPVALLREFRRVLRPTGRLICSVPNDWSDESGKDPNPFHLHVYDLPKLRSQLEAGNYLIELFAAQSATREKRGPTENRQWHAATRRLFALRSDQWKGGEPPDCEWWLAVASRSPFDGEHSGYVETTYPVYQAGNWNVTAFKRDYENPWLVRSIVSTAHRVVDPALLVQLAQQALETLPPQSSDVGGALCVLAYQLLAREHVPIDQVCALMARCEAYLAAPAASPHGIRWSVSLRFVLGCLWLKSGDFDRARTALRRCVALDALAYSPLLVNRTIDACVLLGQLAAARGSEPEAARWWRKGIKLAQQAVQADWREALGDLKAPADFALPELASALERASVCAFALAELPRLHIKRDWWRNLRRDRLSQVRLMNRAYEDQARKMVAEGERKVAEAMRLQRDVEDLLAQLTAADQGLHKQAVELAAYASAVAQLQSTITAYERQSSEYSGANLKLRKELESTYQQLELQREELGLANAEVERQRAELGVYERQAVTLQEQVKAYAAQADELLALARAGEDRLSEAHAQLAAQQSELRAYAEQTEVFSAQLQAYREQSDALVARDEALREQLRLAYAEIERRGAELREYAGQAQRLTELAGQREQALAAAYEQVEKQRSELARYAQQAAAMSAELREYAEQAPQLEARWGQAEAELKAAKATIENQRLALSASQERESRVAHERDDLDTRLQIAVGERETLWAQLGALRARRLRELSDPAFLARQMLRAGLKRDGRRDGTENDGK